MNIRPGRFCGAMMLALGLGAPLAAAATMDFEPLPMGTLYGAAAGNAPSDMVFSQNGIDLHVDNFQLGSFVGFFDAEIGGLYGSFFPTHALQLDNISASFDLSSLAFPVTEVTLEYLEFGGASNFSVNGSTLHELASLADVPANVAPGVTATVNNNVITLSGTIDSFRVGGQELAIDTINAVPEPAVLVLLVAGGVAIVAARRRGSNPPC